MNQNEEKRLTEELELLEKVSHNNRTFNESMIKKIQEENPFTCEQEDKENLLGQYYPIKISLDTYKEIENLFGIGETVLPNYINEEDNDGANYQNTQVKVVHHPGHFCERCWNYESDAVLQEDGTYLCKRCAEVVK